MLGLQVSGLKESEECSGVGLRSGLLEVTTDLLCYCHQPPGSTLSEFTCASHQAQLGFVVTFMSQVAVMGLCLESLSFL